MPVLKIWIIKFGKKQGNLRYELEIQNESGRVDMRKKPDQKIESDNQNNFNKNYKIFKNITVDYGDLAG